MIAVNGSLLRLARIADAEWLIHDHRYAHNDARFVVAWMREHDIDGVEVLWIRPTLLPTRYVSAETVLEDLDRYLAGPNGNRPQRISHFAPATARVRHLS